MCQFGRLVGGGTLARMPATLFLGNRGEPALAGFAFALQHVQRGTGLAGLGAGFGGAGTGIGHAILQCQAIAQLDEARLA